MKQKLITIMVNRLWEEGKKAASLEISQFIPNGYSVKNIVAVPISNDENQPMLSITILCNREG